MGRCPEPWNQKFKNICTVTHFGSESKNHTHTHTEAITNPAACDGKHWEAWRSRTKYSTALSNHKNHQSFLQSSDKGQRNFGNVPVRSTIFTTALQDYMAWKWVKCLLHPGWLTNIFLLPWFLSEELISKHVRFVLVNTPLRKNRSRPNEEILCLFLHRVISLKRMDVL